MSSTSAAPTDARPASASSRSSGPRRVSASGRTESRHSWNALRLAIGFSRHAAAPAAIASACQASRSCPLRATIAPSGVEAEARCRISSMPLPSGSPRSTITTLGR